MQLPRSIAHGLRAALVLGALLAWFSGPARAADDAARSDRAKAQLNALRDKIDSVRQQVASDTHRRSDLSARLAAAEADISAARKRLRTLADDIDSTQQRIAHLTDRRDHERKTLSAELDALRTQVRAAYENGRMSRMRLLLSGQSPEKIGRMLAYYTYFADAQTRQVDHLRAALADLARRQNALNRERRALTRRRRDRAQTLAGLEAQQQQRQRTIAALDKRLASRKSNLADMRASASRLHKLLARLQQQLGELPPTVSGDSPFARRKGHLTPPVSGRVLAYFGTRKGEGSLRWQGEWLAAAEGTPVKAVAGGRVVYVGYMHRYGLIVIVDHGHDYYTLYGHAQSAYVSVGDRVRAGQAIAQAGRSGGHSRSGTYFEIRKGQTAVDPARWLSG